VINFIRFFLLKLKGENESRNCLPSSLIPKRPISQQVVPLHSRICLGNHFGKSKRIVLEKAKELFGNWIEEKSNWKIVLSFVQLSRWSWTEI